MGKPLSVIDIGSNTIHLLVGEVKGGEVFPLVNEKISARLGAGVERTGRIEDGRLRIAAESVELFARISALSGAPAPVIMATSAVRDAENGLDLIGAIRALTQLDVRLISGDEEALLGFRGAMSAAKVEPGTQVLVVDLGGGSAQLTLGKAGGVPEKEISLPLGSNRTTERFVDTDPPKSKELQKLRKAVSEMLPDWDIAEDTAAIGVGGSARAILKITNDTLTPGGLHMLTAELIDRPSSVLSRERGLSPVRARVLPAAATTLAAILDHFGIPYLTVARGGLREGALLTIAEGGEV